MLPCLAVNREPLAAGDRRGVYCAPVLLSLLLACSPVVLDAFEPGTSTPESEGQDDDQPSGDTEDTGPDQVPGVDSGAEPDPDNDETVEVDLFQIERVVDIELSIDDAGLAALAADPYTYVVGDVTIDGTEFSDVGLRIKGRLGSLRYLPSKSAFKIDFLQFGQGRRPDGLEKLNVNNMVQDCAMAHEYASYGAHDLVGVPAPRVAYASVRLNGELYGLYSLIEDYDDEFLKDRFDDASGNLYDGDYKLYSSSDYQLIDFTASAQSLFELDEGEDVGLEDIRAVTNARLAAGTSTFAEDMSEVVNMEQFAVFMAVSAWTGHYDSYSYYSNNYRVYFDPADDGRAVFLPWDPDWAFYANTSVTSAYGTIASGCLRDPTCRGWARDAAAELSETVPGSQLEADLEAIFELTAEHIVADPKKETGMAEVQSCRADLMSWFYRRGGELEAAGF